MKGIGIDIVEVKRFKNLSSRFLKRVYSENEIKYCLSKAMPALHLAARFAVKEAVVKATGRKDIALKDIIIKNFSNGAPSVSIRGERRKFLVSISHTGEYAVAVVAEE